MWTQKNFSGTRHKEPVAPGASREGKWVAGAFLIPCLVRSLAIHFFFKFICVLLKIPCHTPRGTHVALREAALFRTPLSSPRLALLGCGAREPPLPSRTPMAPCVQGDTGLSPPKLLPSWCPRCHDMVNPHTQPKATTGKGSLHPSPPCAPTPGCWSLPRWQDILPGQRDSWAGVPTRYPLPQPVISAPCLCPKEPSLTSLDLSGLSVKMLCPPLGHG